MTDPSMERSSPEAKASWRPRERWGQPCHFSAVDTPPRDDIDQVSIPILLKASRLVTHHSAGPSIPSRRCFLLPPTLIPSTTSCRPGHRQEMHQDRTHHRALAAPATAGWGTVPLPGGSHGSSTYLQERRQTSVCTLPIGRATTSLPRATRGPLSAPSAKRGPALPRRLHFPTAHPTTTWRTSGSASQTFTSEFQALHQL